MAKSFLVGKYNLVPPFTEFNQLLGEKEKEHPKNQEENANKDIQGNKFSHFPSPP
jgi:hypothetical protein